MDKISSLNLDISKLSPEQLSGLLKLYARLYMAADGFWYLSVKDKVNNDIALDCDIRVWEIMARYEAKKFINQFDIKGNDVFTLAQVMQYSPWFLNFDYSMEKIDDTSVRLTISRCPTLEALEKEGEGREDQICNVVEPRVFGAYAAYVNPEIRVIRQKTPPRKQWDGICCQWLFDMK